METVHWKVLLVNVYHLLTVVRIKMDQLVLCKQIQLGYFDGREIRPTLVAKKVQRMFRPAAYYADTIVRTEQ